MKYRVVRHMTFAGKDYEPGDAIEHATIVGKGGLDKPDTLIRTRYIESHVDPRDMRKDELFDYARRLKLSPSSRDTKAELQAMVSRYLQEADEAMAARS